MKIALLGYGKMGKMIETCALATGYEIVARIGRKASAEEWQQVQKADVSIDFSHASCLLEHVQFCAAKQQNLIIGTTGWENQEEKVMAEIKKAEIGCLYSANFSVGVQLFISMVQYAAQLMNSFHEYDVGAVEYHHRQKADRPSGTAKYLAQELARQMPRIKDLEVANVRCGFIPGTHTIHFDSPADTITLTHQARDRMGFARGAIRAAEWIKGKQGFYTMQDLLSQLTINREDCKI
jgi:4-hydroxy-tetrahydrodipicolinate reductase